jgi:hypothetical protein
MSSLTMKNGPPANIDWTISIPEGTIPYVYTEDYDGLEFVSYPEHRGFDVDRFGRGDFSAACFLQNWLFFGVLYTGPGLSSQRPDPDQ